MAVQTACAYMRSIIHYRSAVRGIPIHQHWRTYDGAVSIPLCSLCTHVRVMASVGKVADIGAVRICLSATRQLACACTRIRIVLPILELLL